VPDRVLHLTAGLSRPSEDLNQEGAGLAHNALLSEPGFVGLKDRRILITETGSKFPSMEGVRLPVLWQGWVSAGLCGLAIYRPQAGGLR